MLTLVDGNLVVSGDVDLGGGALHVSDSSKGSHSLILDGGRFDVKSSGYVAISAANTDSPNVSASEILLQSGTSTSSAGGSGGDFFAFAGDGAGGECIDELLMRLTFLIILLISCTTFFVMWYRTVIGWFAWSRR